MFTTENIIDDFPRSVNFSACVFAKKVIPYEKALLRINSQLTDDDLRRRCDYEIDNGGTLDIDEQIKSIIKDAKIEAKRID